MIKYIDFFLLDILLFVSDWSYPSLENISILFRILANTQDRQNTFLLIY